MSAETRQRRLSVNGSHTRLIQAGPSDAGEAVVFVHGNPGSADDWSTLLQAVAGAGARAVALDLPDFGEAQAPASFQHSVPAYGEFLAQALSALHIGKVHLVAHDFGGLIGLIWAAAHPDSLASATLIDTGFLPEYRWHRAARIWRKPLLGELFQASTTRPGFRWAVNRNEPRGLPREFIDEMYNHYDRRTRRAVLKLYRATDNPGGSVPGLVETLAPRDIPALVIWGEDDAYLPAEYAARQRDVFPSADVHVLPASGHWPYVDAAETVKRLLVEFLAGIGARSVSEDRVPA